MHFPIEKKPVRRGSAAPTAEEAAQIKTQIENQDDSDDVEAEKSARYAETFDDGPLYDKRK